MPSPGAGHDPRPTRARMVDSAAELLRERGAAAVTVDAVLAHSGAPRGSVYHHFPGGRGQLLLEAVEQAGDAVSRRLSRAVAAGDPQRAVSTFLDFWRRSLADSGFRAGCPVLAVAVDSQSDIPGAEAAVRRIFAAWHDQLTELLRAAGYPPPRAARLSTMIVAAVEGAVILCRAQGDAAALDDIAAEIDLLLASR